MSENYEAIGIAVRARDAIRIDLRRGVQKDRSFFLAAVNIADLWDGITVPVYRITLGRATRCRSRSATRASRARGAWSS